MNKRTRLIVSLLFVVLIILAVAITRFYTDAEDNPAKNGGGESIEKILSSNEEGYSVFSDSSGNCGIAESGRITAAAEWHSLEFADNLRCIASKKVDGKLKYGCVDLEGNVIVPLIYSSIGKKIIMGMELYCAESADDGSFVLYNQEFIPCFSTPWEKCEFSEDEIILGSSDGSYVYTVGNDGLLFKRAAVSGSIMNRPYELNIYSRVLLSKLSPVMIEEMLNFTEMYVEYAFRLDDSAMREKGADLRKFSAVYPDSDEITTRRLKAVPEIHIYNVGSENGIPFYEVSLSADADILYTAENGENASFPHTIKASIMFCGNFDADLEALSGSFEPRIPEYPQEETTEGATTDTPDTNRNGE